jgi:quercetin dioxygenase-like cupin family protein
MKALNKVTFAALAFLAPSGIAFAEEGHKGHFITQNDVKYDVIIPDAVSFGTVSGNREKGPHGTFVVIKKGAATPSHTHSTEYSAVVIRGKLENPIKGNAATEAALGSGSYYHVPANAEHITRCAADSPEDCMTFFWQATPFDFTPVN